MGKLNDLTGRQFSRLTVVRQCGFDARGNALWVCNCVCGQETTVRGARLLSKNTRSCGCLVKADRTGERYKGKIITGSAVNLVTTVKHPWVCIHCGSRGLSTIDAIKKSLRCRNCQQYGKPQDLTGQRFNRLTAIRRTERKRGTNYYWEFRCTCGNVKEILGTHAKNDYIISCGCAAMEHVVQLGKSNKVHGESDTPIHRAWCGMFSRARNHPLYKNVYICDEWNNYYSFKRFALDNGWFDGCHTHRKNPSGNYEPGNVKFLTPENHRKVHVELRRKAA